jgi:anion-transporting  ArsA/GET3 family ATPase
MQMNTEASLREYLKVQARVPVFGRLGPLARAFDFVANAAPGVKEILTVGKVVWELRESLQGRSNWDLIVVDAAATGHVIGQLDAPRAIQELVQVGPVRNQTDWMVQLLSDPALTALNVVTAPEEMPVNETIELVERARDELAVPLGVVIVNRVLPELFTHADEAVFDALREPAATDALTRAAGPGATAVLDAARLAVSLRRGRSAHLTRLREEVDLPLLLLPYLFVRDHGLRVTRMVAEALGQELGY